jgi:hypothetical protein
VTGELVAAGVAFLTRRENFTEKFFAALGFLSGVIALRTFGFMIEGNFSCALVEPPHILPFLSPQIGGHKSVSSM